MNSDSERWAKIPGYENSYAVSSTGRVKSLERQVMRSNGSPYRVREKILRPMLQEPYGYRIVVLSDRGCQRRYFVRKLRREAFP